MDFEPKMINYSLRLKLLKTFFCKHASISHLHRVWQCDHKRAQLNEDRHVLVCAVSGLLSSLRLN